MIQKNYQVLTVADNKQVNIHYLQAGSGDKNLVVLHPSPLSAGFMKPVIELAQQLGFNVIAWDLPGYGNSDALSDSEKTLAEYADCLSLFLSSLNIKSAVVYGNATGAQIAIEFSKLYPQLCERLVLENAAIFTDSERAEFFQHYFPDLSVKEDGSHINLIWQMVNQLFEYFPWYNTKEEAKITGPKPPQAVIQAAFLDYLKAGVNYATAYKAALNNERAEQIQAVTVETDILLWQNSIIAKFSERLTDIALPQNIQLHRAGPSLEQRFELLSQLLKR